MISHGTPSDLTRTQNHLKTVTADAASGDSGTRTPRAQPNSSITRYLVERELACFVYLCHHLLH